MTELTEDSRIDRMLAEGKLTAEEAERLRGSLAAHAERETLTELTQARANAIQVTGAIGNDPQTVEQLKAIEAAQGEVESALARLFAIVENYPNLKASQNFLSLQDQIEGTENRVAMERRNYNEFSRRYNTKLQTFPGNIVAEMMGFEAKPYFEAEIEALKGLEDPFGRRSES